MVSYATVVYIVSIGVVMFTYTFLWDLYQAFWNGALSLGVNATILNYLFILHDWIPVAFLFSSTFWYLVQAQRRVPG